MGVRASASGIRMTTSRSTSRFVRKRFPPCLSPPSTLADAILDCMSSPVPRSVYKYTLARTYVFVDLFSTRPPDVYRLWSNTVCPITDPCVRASSSITLYLLGTTTQVRSSNCYVFVSAQSFEGDVSRSSIAIHSDYFGSLPAVAGSLRR